MGCAGSWSRSTGKGLHGAGSVAVVAQPQRLLLGRTRFPDDHAGEADGPGLRMFQLLGEPGAQPGWMRSHSFLPPSKGHHENRGDRKGP